MAVDLEKLQQLLTNKLREKFGEQIREVSEYHGDITVLIDRAAVKPVMYMLRDDPDFRFDLMTYVTGADYSGLGRKVRYQVMWNLVSTYKAHRVRVSTEVPEDDPTVDSVVELWPGANFQEREAYDMFGVIFQGHPDLRRILMPDDWQGHPLRKDFPLGGVKSFYFKRSTDPHAGEPPDLVPRIRVQESDI